MTLLIASIGSNHFPCPANPQTPAGDAVVGSPAIVLGIPYPLPVAAAGCLGTLTINGFNIGGAGGSAGSSMVDLTIWGQREIVAAINSAPIGVTASIDRNSRINLQTLPGQPINIAGGATLLAALGFTAGVTSN